MAKNQSYYILDETKDNDYFNMRFHDVSGNAVAYRFGVKNRAKTHLLFNDSMNQNKIYIDVEDSGDLHLDGVFLKEVKNARIVLNIGKNSAVHLYFCEISSFDLQMNIEINLLEKESSVDVHFVSVASEKASKELEVKINHLAPNTHSNIELKGISQNEAKIHFLPRSVIHPNIPFCTAFQTNRIVNLNDESRGVIRPMLEINNNEVQASHSAIVGSIKDNEIFYLLSRGLDYRQARSLIVKGTIMPVYNGLPDYEDKHKFMIVYDRGNY